MVNADKKRSDRRTKSKFHGNRHTGAVQPPVSGEKRNIDKVNSPNSSFSKLGPRKKPRVENNDELEGNRFINIQLLCEFLMDLNCPTCGDKSFDVREVIYGLASKITVTCKKQDCGYEKSFETSKRGKGKSRYHVINRQYTLAMCAIGRHHKQAVRFAVNMDMPPPLTTNTWRCVKCHCII